jgi:16S rRNA (cytosine967-C5)-methyltransferase
VICLSKSVRYYAFSILKKVFAEKAFLNIALKEVNGIVSDTRDISYITSLTNSVLENLGQIDFSLKNLIEGKRVHSSIRIILRMAVCELMFMSTVERAAVNEAVNLCGEIGKQDLKGFVNAVLRNFIKVKNKIEYPNIDDDISIYLEVFSGYKTWFIDEIISDYGEEFAKEFLLYKRDDKDFTHIRLNTLNYSQKDIIDALKKDELSVSLDNSFEDSAYIKNFTNIENREAYKNGMIAVQGKASMLCVKLAGVKRNMSILDACAAPGGKTAYISLLMKNEGAVTAFDVHAHRVELIEKNMKRLGCENVDAKVKDVSIFDESLKSKFDLVFLDMPCSSMGLAYKKADIRIFKEKADIESLAALQKQLLNAAKNYVKPDGILMYVTCSITKSESDLSWFFKKNKNFVEMDLNMPKGIDFIKAEHGIKLFPNVSGMDGFFICKMRRN